MIKTIALAAALAFGAMTVPAFAQAPAATQAAAFSADSTMGDLMGNAGARAVLERHIPEVVGNPQISQAASMTLRQLAQYVSTLTEEKLTEINTDLAAVQ